MTEIIPVPYSTVPNASIELRSTNIELRTKTRTMAGHARVTWDLAQDKVTIAAEFPTPPNSIDEVDEDAPVVRLGNRAQKLKC